MVYCNRGGGGVGTIGNNSTNTNNQNNTGYTSTYYNFPYPPNNRGSSL